MGLVDGFARCGQYPPRLVLDRCLFCIQVVGILFQSSRRNLLTTDVLGSHCHIYHCQSRTSIRGQICAKSLFPIRYRYHPRTRSDKENSIILTNLQLSMMWYQRSRPRLSPILQSRVSTPTIQALMKINGPFTHLQSHLPMPPPITDEVKMAVMEQISHAIDRRLKHP